MNTESTHDDAELPGRDHGAFGPGAGSRCWPLPSDSEEAQLALPDGDPGADEAALAGSVHARRRPHRADRGRLVRAVRPLVPLEPADLAAVGFDEQRAASLACAEPGAPGPRTAYECIAAICAAERAAA
ncbi:hypothetical protein GCM10020358_43150 [Amorphoplanes nipponensis]|uniref:Uncharacterized protein n=1 Tax=Actinoplanes nipponensis TaxID=135950 RepID=A0A919JQU8_9ACTN|nr:hypothetical protein [Actinoplanes nipponensis]GIE53785.1 hypothetical protein Ani05nite_73190 [Actinoplanes nipponensis]